ncbi:MAG TPA: ATP-binding protein [Chloroflexota bacterium]|nr:ATP-binding protein [Chloroflexota bacterium]
MRLYLRRPGWAWTWRDLNLQAKLTLYGVLLALAAVGVTSAVAWRLMDQLAETVARERLDHAAEVVNSEYTNLLENARIIAEAIAAWPPLERASTAEAVETIVSRLPRSSFLQAISRTRSIDLIAVVGPDATTLLEIERGQAAGRGASLRNEEAVMRALAGETAEGLVFADEGVRAEVTLPIRSGDEIVGAVLTAVFLDNALVDRLKSATAFDVTFYAGDYATATTLRLPSGARQTGMLAPLDVLAEVVGEGRAVERIGRTPQGRVIVRYYPVQGIDGRVVGMFSISAPVAQLFESRTQALTVFVPVVATVFVLALVAGAYAARALSLPIRSLVVAVQRIGEGDLTQPVLVASRDEVGRLARAIEDMRLRLLQHAAEQEQLNRLKDQYLFNVAHELKTPLASLVATVELLSQHDGALSPEEQRHLIAVLQRSTARFQALVDNLLDLGSLRAGRFNIHPRPAALRDIVAEAVASMQPLLEARQQQVAWRFDPSLVVLADARRIQQVLVNLLSNANKHGPVGDTIEVRAEQQDSEVWIAVTDHGPGIPEAEQPRLFEAYFRSVMAQESTPGVGLGLAIVKAIVEAHGGRVGMDSRPGAGTTVWFTLPAAVRREAAPALATNAPAAPGER